MSKATQQIRKAIDSTLDALELTDFGDGFESAIGGLDELSNLKHNAGDTVAAEILRWAAKELRGENA
jgi:soluble cytochrome b562